MSKKILAMVLAGVMAIGMAACTAAPADPAAPASSGAASGEAAAPADDWAAKTGTKTFAAIAKEDLKIGIVYVGPVGDMGYSYAHDQGRLKMMKELGLSDDQVLIVEDVPEEAECATQLRGLIDQGCNVIIATSFGHMDYTAEVAKEHPEVIFMHCSGYTTGENMSAYFGRMYETRYLSGVVAGVKSKEIGNNKLGYVAAMPIPEVVRGANAFALGVKSVNPEATVEVKFTNSWFDPAVEKQLALELLNSGCGIIGQHCDTTGPQVAADEKGGFAIGYNAATFAAAPKAYLSSPLWDWGVYYTAQIQAVMDGTWTSSNYWGEMKEGIVLMDELSANCAPGTKEAVDSAKAKLDDQSLQVFAGPISDNNGTEKVPAGTVMTDGEMLSMDWFVDNVIGTV